MQSTLAQSAQLGCQRVSVSRRSPIAAVSPARRTVCRAVRSQVVRAQQQQEQKPLALPVGLTAGLAAAMASPLAAHADVTPSLKNLLFSVVAGGFVLTAIAAAVTGVSNFDPLSRR